MKVAIVQPAYLPWLGYFDLLDQVDQFVFLDSVQFEKRSWQQRNRIKGPDGLQWLTIPVASRGRRDQHIREAEISETDFWSGHLRAIDTNYRRAPFFGRYFGALGERMRHDSAEGNLSRLTIGVIHWLRDALGNKTKTICSSEIAAQGKRSQLLAEICAALGASEYISPLGSVDYLLDEMPLFAERGIKVEFQHYEHPTYKQLFPPFQAYACALDLLLNEGDGAMEIVRSGRRAPFTPEEARAHAEKNGGKKPDGSVTEVKAAS